MPTKSEIWKIFYSNESKYKNDHYHKNAWCHGCLNTCKKKMRADDSVSLALGEIEVARSEEELTAQGQLIFDDY
jgi:exonuclease III